MPDERRGEARVGREQARPAQRRRQAPRQRREARECEDRGHRQRRVRLEADDEGAFFETLHRLRGPLVEDDVEACEERDGAVEDVGGEARGPERRVLRVARNDLGHDDL